MEQSDLGMFSEAVLENPIKDHRKRTTEFVLYNCGCGFRTMHSELAHQHAAETGHKLTIYGRLGLEVRS